MERLIERIRKNDTEDPLVQAMGEAGIIYETEETGKGSLRKAYFSKSLAA